VKTLTYVVIAILRQKRDALTNQLVRGLTLKLFLCAENITDKVSISKRTLAQAMHHRQARRVVVL
jgi:hypothetical protein